MDWKTLLAYITWSVDQHLLLRNEYLVTENRMLRHHIKGRVRLSDGERKVLAEIGQKLGKPALQEVATLVKPDTILGPPGANVGFFTVRRSGGGIPTSLPYRTARKNNGIRNTSPEMVGMRRAHFPGSLPFTPRFSPF